MKFGPDTNPLECLPTGNRSRNFKEKRMGTLLAHPFLTAFVIWGAGFVIGTIFGQKLAEKPQVLFGPEPHQIVGMHPVILGELIQEGKWVIDDSTK
jgi:hypothetical protein